MINHVNCNKHIEILLTSDWKCIKCEKEKLKTCLIHNIKIPKQDCLGCLYWNNSKCNNHSINLNKNNKCSKCLQNIKMQIKRKTSTKVINNEQEYEKKRAKGKTIEAFCDIETTTDKNIVDYVNKYNRDFSRIKRKKWEKNLKEYVESDLYTKPSSYLITFCHNENIENLITNDDIKNNKLTEILNETNNFNCELKKHCDDSNCKFMEMNHWRYSFYKEEHFLLFIEEFMSSANIWTHNGAKFDNWFLKGTLEKSGYVLYLDFKFKEEAVLMLKDEDVSTNEHLVAMINNLLSLWEIKYEILEKQYKERDKSVLPSSKKQKQWISAQWKNDIGLNKHYEILIDGKNRILSLNIYLKEKYLTTKKKKKITKFRKVTFKDNALLFTTTVKQIGNDLAKYYSSTGLKNAKELLRKKEIANQHNKYELYKSNNEMLNDYQGTVLEYAYQDTFIIYMWHEFMKKTVDKKFFERVKLTAGSTAFNEFLTEFGLDYIKNNDIEQEINHKTKFKKAKYNNKFLSPNQLRKIITRKTMPYKMN